MLHDPHDLEKKLLLMWVAGQLRRLWPLDQDRDLGIAHDVVGHTANE